MLSPIKNDTRSPHEKEDDEPDYNRAHAVKYWKKFCSFPYALPYQNNSYCSNKRIQDRSAAKVESELILELVEEGVDLFQHI
jgi:hypothetical protein